MQAILADLNNADCSHTITTQQAALTPSTGYTLILADQTDQTKACLFFDIKHGSG